MTHAGRRVLPARHFADLTFPLQDYPLHAMVILRPPS